MKAMILAAGRGERLRPLTNKKPKPLIEVGGKPLIEWHIERLRAARVMELIVNVSWLKEQLIAFLGDGSRWGVSITVVEEPPGALDTGGGIRNALPLLGDEPFWVVNGDVFCDFGFQPTSLAARDLGKLVLTPGQRGDFSLSKARVSNAGQPAYTFAGIALYRRALLSSGMGRFPITPLLRGAADDARLAGQLHDGVWHDAGTPARLARLRETLE